MTRPQSDQDVSRAFSAAPAWSQQAAIISDSPGSISSAYGPASRKPLQRQRPGRGSAVVEMVQAQQERRLVAAAGVKEPPRNLRHGRHVAGRQRLVQHAPGPCAVLQFVHFAALARHLSDQPLRLRFQTAMNGRILLGLEEEVFRRVQDVAQIADRLAKAAFRQQLPRIGQLLQGAAIGGDKHIFSNVLVGRRTRQGHGRHGHWPPRFLPHLPPPFGRQRRQKCDGQTKAPLLGSSVSSRCKPLCHLVFLPRARLSHLRKARPRGGHG